MRNAKKGQRFISLLDAAAKKELKRLQLQARLEKAQQAIVDDERKEADRASKLASRQQSEAVSALNPMVVHSQGDDVGASRSNGNGQSN